jgi:hypothetical protein
MMWGTTSSCGKLTGDSGNGFEALLIGDCRSFRSWWEISRYAFSDFCNTSALFRHGAMSELSP